MSRLDARLEVWARARWAGPALFLVALAVFAVQALGWPLQRGRDSWDYLVYYLSLPDGETPFELVMLMRTPLSALALGLPLDLGGERLLELVMALSFATTTVAWAAVARHFSATAALLAAALVLANPVFALAFHEASSDFVATTGFALYALAVVRAWREPGSGRFAVVGGLVAALALARPAYQALILGAVLPLLAPGSLRDRAVRTAVFCLAVVLPLAGWAAVNGVRYGQTTVSRAGTYNIPFYTAFRAGEIDASNGPASRLLGRLVERNVLSLEPYRRLGVDVTTYFETRSNFEAVRLAGLADRLGGIGSDYELLVDAALEVPDDDGLRLAGVSVRRSLDAAWELASSNATHESRLRPSATTPPPAPTVLVAGRPVPNPVALGIPEGGEAYGFLACAGNQIERCVLSDASARYRDRSLARRYTEVTDRVVRWDRELGTGTPRSVVERGLSAVNRRLPAPWLWAAVALAGLALRRPSGWPALLWLVLAAAGMLVVHAIGVGPDLFYALPVLPAWVVAAVCAVTGRRLARSPQEPHPRLPAPV